MCLQYLHVCVKKKDVTVENFGLQRMLDVGGGACKFGKMLAKKVVPQRFWCMCERGFFLEK